MRRVFSWLPDSNRRPKTSSRIPCEARADRATFQPEWGWGASQAQRALCSPRRTLPGRACAHNRPSRRPQCVQFAPPRAPPGTRLPAGRGNRTRGPRPRRQLGSRPRRHSQREGVRGRERRGSPVEGEALPRRSRGGLHLPLPVTVRQARAQAQPRRRRATSSQGRDGQIQRSGATRNRTEKAAPAPSRRQRRRHDQ